MYPTVSSPLSANLRGPRRSARPSALPRLPLSPAGQRLVAGAPDLPARLATAGDDYELLLPRAGSPATRILALSAELRLPVTAIGTIERGGGVRLGDDGGKASTE